MTSFICRSLPWQSIVVGLLLVSTCGCIKLKSGPGSPSTAASTAVEPTAPVSNYRFVRIIDASDPTIHPDGSWIDAVVLQKPQLPGAESEPPTYAVGVESFTPGTRAETVEGLELKPGLGENTEGALHQPDAFAAYPVLTTCTLDAGFVRLGNGGDIVLKMENAMETGDVLEVLEVGKCKTNWDSQMAPEAALEIYIGTSPEGPWQYAGRGSSPSVKVDVPRLE